MEALQVVFVGAPVCHGAHLVYPGTDEEEANAELPVQTIRGERRGPGPAPRSPPRAAAGLARPGDRPTAPDEVSPATPRPTLKATFKSRRRLTIRAGTTHSQLDLSTLSDARYGTLRDLGLAAGLAGAKLDHDESVPHRAAPRAAATRSR